MKGSIDIIYKNKTYRKIVNRDFYPEQLGIQIVEDLRYLQNCFQKKELEHLLEHMVIISNINELSEQQKQIFQKYFPDPHSLETTEYGILKTIIYGFLLTHSKQEIFHYIINFDTYFFSIQIRTDLYTSDFIIGDLNSEEETMEQYPFENLTLFVERYSKYR